MLCTFVTFDLSSLIKKIEIVTPLLTSCAKFERLQNLSHL